MTRHDRWLRTLNVLVARHVMGWKEDQIASPKLRQPGSFYYVDGMGCRTANPQRWFSPSTVTDDALEAAICLFKKVGVVVRLEFEGYDSSGTSVLLWSASVSGYIGREYSEMPAEAICLAMLSALGVEVPTIPAGKVKK